MLQIRLQLWRTWMVDLPWTRCLTVSNKLIIQNLHLVGYFHTRWNPINYFFIKIICLFNLPFWFWYFSVFERIISSFQIRWLTETDITFLLDTPLLLPDAIQICLPSIHPPSSTIIHHRMSLSMHGLNFQDQMPYIVERYLSRWSFLFFHPVWRLKWQVWEPSPALQQLAISVATVIVVRRIMSFLGESRILFLVE